MNKSNQTKRPSEVNEQMRELFIKRANSEHLKEESRKKVMETQFRRAIDGKKFVVKGNIK